MDSGNSGMAAIVASAAASIESQTVAIFPQGLTHIDARCNAGERRVLHQLKRCLEDDYLVWHDVPIGPKARQPDFVILSPRWGVLLLEVKDWKRSTLASATRDAVELALPRGRVTQAHPLRQARDVAMELVHLMQQPPLAGAAALVDVAQALGEDCHAGCLSA